MILLKEIIRKQGININGRTISREAVRAIIRNSNLLLMIYSSKDGDYKFPGGGLNSGESFSEALIREVKEESGATVLTIEKEFGKIIEFDKPTEVDYDVFEMTSYYYICTIDPYLGNQSLDPYEQDLGFTPVWVDINDAITNNKLILSNAQKEIPRWTLRETYVLEYIYHNYHLFN